jgi:HdeA/HdeB family
MLSALLWPPTARAQETIDAAKITCNQFMFGRIADSRTISIWLLGYYSGMRKNSVIDIAAVQKSSQSWCSIVWRIPKYLSWTPPKTYST